MKATALLASAALLLLPEIANAKRLVPVEVRASSSHPEESNMNYDAARITDGKLTTAWIEGESGSGLGSWIEMDLGEEKTVHKLKIWAGFWYSRDYWRRTNRPQEIEVRWSDGSSDRFQLPDEMVPHEFVLDTPRPTTSARVILRGVHPGNTWLDTAISQVQLFDAEPDERAVARAITASSQRPDDGDGTYTPMNVADDLTDSMWCIGDEEEASEGPWLDFTFPAERRVEALELVNGNATSLSFWMRGARATTAELAFPDGSTHEISIRNAMMAQTIEFPPRLASGVKITFTDVAEGTEGDPLCISGAHFR